MNCIDHGQSKKYGSKRYKGRVTNYNRAVYQEKHGDLAEGLVVMHTCDNPRCINIEHLVAGTQQDNVMDMLEKGRDNYANLGREDHSQSKLTEIDVAAIRESTLYQRELAEIYGVSRTTISAVKTGRSWT